MQLVNMRGAVHGQIKRSRSLQTDETTHLRTIGIPEPDKKGGEGRGLRREGM